MKQQSALVYVLKGLIPYSRENLALAFKPNKFFNDLEKLSGKRRKTLQTAYYRALDRGLVHERTSLTLDGWEEVLPFVGKTLQQDVVLMVVFDIPQDLSPLRRELRRVLKKLHFSQAQQSVWICEYDYTAYVKKYIEKMSLEDYVQVYEAARIC